LIYFADGAQITASLPSDKRLDGVVSGTAGKKGVFLDGVRQTGGAVSGDTASYAILVDSKANGTGGGDLTNTRQTRDLTLIEVDDGVGVTLSSNQFTLSAGDYIILVKASSIGVNNYIRTWLYNVTDAADQAFGMSAFQANHSERCPVFAHVSISVDTTYEVQHQANVNVVDGLGFAFTSGDTEIYSTVEIWKVG
jgi:hypothetical protein